MTDEQIIKALECCATDDGDDCSQCPYGNIVYKSGSGGCVNRCRKDALDFINRQKADIERLEHIRKGDKQLINSLNKCYKLAKSEAIKEFAERLKSKLANLSVRTKTHGRKTMPNYVDDIANQILHDVVSQETDNLVKENDGGAGMSQFTVNKDMFGQYCHIPTDTSGNMHIYKIVSQIESNVYCEVPLVVNSKETIHRNIVPVLLVIHSGIDETEVRKVALSDCKIIANNESEIVHGKWENMTEVNSAYLNTYRCSACGTTFWIDEIPEDANYNHCPNCGAKMDKE